MSQVYTNIDYVLKGSKTVTKEESRECLGGLLGRLDKVDVADIYVYKKDQKDPKSDVSVEGAPMGQYVGLMKRMGFRMDLEDLHVARTGTVSSAGSYSSTGKNYVRVHVAMSEMTQVANIVALNSLRYAYSRYSSSHGQEGEQLGHTLIPHLLRLATSDMADTDLFNLWMLLHSALPIQTHTFSHGSFYRRFDKAMLNAFLTQQEHKLYSSFNSCRMHRIVGRIPAHETPLSIPTSRREMFDRQFGKGNWMDKKYADWMTMAALLKKNASLDELWGEYNKWEPQAKTWQPT